ncbi:MAG: hypothetical protein JWP89_1242 [Schlesneria sp.]|nr:hypothetical protein [Schlesneria sp.]
MAGFVSPWQCFGGVCRFLSGMGFQSVALALVCDCHRELVLHRNSDGLETHPTEEKRPHALTAVRQSTGVAGCYGPLRVSILSNDNYAEGCVRA